MNTTQEEIDLGTLLRDYCARLPRFPDGRIDYTDSEEAPVLTCFVEYDEKILLLKRSDKVGTYRGMWNSVSGYIDDTIPLQKKILQELREELGLDENVIEDIRIRQPYRSVDEGIGKTWIIVP